MAIAKKSKAKVSASKKTTAKSVKTVKVAKKAKLEHGTLVKYRKDACRCRKCKEANNSQWREYYAKHKAKVQAEKQMNEMAVQTAKAINEKLKATKVEKPVKRHKSVKAEIAEFKANQAARKAFRTKVAEPVVA